MAEPKILKNYIENPSTSTGYAVVNLRTGGRTFHRHVHRLVLEAFVGPCPPGQQARHFPDNDRTNCKLGNLRWGTQSENEQDKKDIGIYPFGEKHPMAKLTNAAVLAIRKGYAAGVLQKDLAATYGVGRAYISVLCARKAWKHLA